ncbi:MAG: HAD family hydrolase [Cyanobacteria bacterium J06628_6]
MTVDLRQRRCWVFDMDGTLTLGIHDFEAIRQELGLPVGEPILESLMRLEQTDPAAAAAKHRQLAEIELAIARQATAQPGVGDLLAWLKSHHLPIGVLTRNGKSMAHETLKACDLLSFFEPDYILSRDCCPPKPQPDGILKLLSLWDRQPSEAVMVGDYRFDLEAGRNAGTATVYIDPTGGFPWQAQADHSISDFETVLGWLQSA